MAKKESSFDVVSTVDLQEIDNAYQMCARELTQRYDLKQTDSTIEFSKAEKTITIVSPSNYVSSQIIQILNARLLKRGVDPLCISWDEPKAASGAMVRQVGHIIEGIDKEVAKKISKDIRDLKLKVKPTIESDKLRVTSASKDELQEVIAFLKSQEYGLPLQFTNYR